MAPSLDRLLVDTHLSLQLASCYSRVHSNRDGQEELSLKEQYCCVALILLLRL